MPDRNDWGTMRPLPRAVTATGLLAGLLAASLLSPSLPGSSAATGSTTQPPVGAVQPGSGVVSPTPSAATPDVLDGHVEDVTTVGDTVVLGGDFRAAADPGSTTSLPRSGVLAFDAATGTVAPGFAPRLDGRVHAVLAGPEGSVYVGGTFRTLDGTVAPKLARLDLATGRPVPGFRPPRLNGRVDDLALSGGRLFVGGTFTTAGGQPRGGLLTLDAATGALDPYLQLDVEGHHNWPGPDPARPGAKGPVGVSRLDISSDGRSLVAIGNFRTVAGVRHPQVFRADLTAGGARLADWSTEGYDHPCAARAFDSWVRDVAFSPDGQFFVVVGSGGYARTDGRLCDSAARWETSATGAALQPTWVDWSGGDSLLSVEVTRDAVYVGGHQRWMNNALASDEPGPGAVPRPGVAALDPVNGLPLDWNPGRHPRGVGTTALHASARGLYAGADTDTYGLPDQRVRRAKIAHFPFAGGSVRGADATPALPGTVVSVGTAPAAPPGAVLHRINAGGPALPATDGGPGWAADEAADSPYRTAGSWSTGYPPAVARDGALPPSTPTALFDTERWDPPAAPGMTWRLPVPAGAPLLVRLYFADRCWCTAQPGQRRFDVAVEGAVVLSGYDIGAAVGSGVGTVRELPARTSDGVLDIDFRHVLENPLVNGIEVLRAAGPAAPPLTARRLDGTTAGPAVAVPATDATPWDQVRGAFVVDGRLFTGRADDGLLHVRSVDGTSLGPDTALDPYSGTPWQHVPDGSGGTYAGGAASLSAQMRDVSSMFYAAGRLYYTLAGRPELYERAFTPDSGVLGDRASVVPTGRDWSRTGGAFLDARAGRLYVAEADRLLALDWQAASPVPGQPVAGHPVGPAVTVSDTGPWGGRALWLTG